jgi:hypothetical protein
MFQWVHNLLKPHVWRQSISCVTMRDQEPLGLGVPAVCPGRAPGSRTAAACVPATRRYSLLASTLL